MIFTFGLLKFLGLGIPILIPRSSLVQTALWPNKRRSPNGGKTSERGAKLHKHIPSKANNYNQLLGLANNFLCHCTRNAIIGRRDELNFHLACAYVVIRVVPPTINNVIIKQAN